MGIKQICHVYFGSKKDLTKVTGGENYQLFADLNPGKYSQLWAAFLWECGCVVFPPPKVPLLWDFLSQEAGNEFIPWPSTALVPC